MGVENKAWDWSKSNGDHWLFPSEESYFILNRWKDLGFSTFLDLGCGLGRHSLQFARAGFEVYALDFSRQAVDALASKAKERNLNIRTTCCDMISLPYREAFFDCILAYHVISHTTTEGIMRTISEISRIVRADGEIFLTLCSKLMGRRKTDQPSRRRKYDNKERGGTRARHPSLFCR